MEEKAEIYDMEGSSSLSPPLLPPPRPRVKQSTRKCLSGSRDEKEK
jgi:hypothetical protein